MSSDQLERLKEALAGRYQFERELGTGAFATVFLARDLRLERHVAVKVLHVEPTSDLNEIRFLREIRFLAALQHPNIVPVHDSGHLENLLYYVMPYMRGESLRERIKRERQLAIPDAVRITCEIADALDCAHGTGVIHRDIKPENILLSGAHPMLADFGVARAINMSRGRKITRTGFGSPGTPAYMSPEQMLGEREVDQRTDIYSLGCVLFEMLTGQAPFEGSGGFVKRFTEAAPSARALRADISPMLDQSVAKALGRTPEERFATAAEMGKALSRSETTISEPVGLPGDIAVPVQAVKPESNRAPANQLWIESSAWRWRAVVAGIAALIVILGARPAIGYFRNSPAEPAPLDPRRIAVLDFEDQSPDRSLGHISSGLTVSLIHELSGASALQVVSRNGVKAFQQRALSLDSMVSGLRLGTLVEGSVQQSKGRLRVTVQLVDGASKTQLESANIERPMGELFLVEDDLAHRVAQLLRRRIGVELRIRETVAGTTNARARELVFRADKLRDDAATEASSGDTLEFGHAISRLLSADSLLGAAETIDRHWIAPVVESGWIALELSQLQGGAERVDMLHRATDRANRALARDSLNASALLLRGTVSYWEAARLPLGDREFSNHLARAEADLKRSLAIDTSLATAWGTLSLVRVARGDVTEAARDARTALAMDTYLTDAPLILLTLYGANLMKGSMSDAWQWCDRGAEDYPRDPRFIECRLTLLAEDLGRPPDPRTAWTLVAKANEIDPPSHARAVGRAYLPIYREMMAAATSARAGQVERARAVSSRAWRDVDNDADVRMDLVYEEAYVHLLLGESSQAISLLSEYLAARPSLRALVARHPRWRPLWRDSAFVQLTRGVTPSLK